MYWIAQLRTNLVKVCLFPKYRDCLKTYSLENKLDLQNVCCEWLQTVVYKTDSLYRTGKLCQNLVTKSSLKIGKPDGLQNNCMFVKKTERPKSCSKRIHTNLVKAHLDVLKLIREVYCTTKSVTNLVRTCLFEVKKILWKVVVPRLT